MRRNLTQWSGLAALAVVAAAVARRHTPVRPPPPVRPAGPATVRSSGGAADLNSGDSSTTFTLRLPVGAGLPR